MLFAVATSHESKSIYAGNTRAEGMRPAQVNAFHQILYGNHRPRQQCEILRNQNNESDASRGKKTWESRWTKVSHASRGTTLMSLKMELFGIIPCQPARLPRSPIRPTYDTNQTLQKNIAASMNHPPMLLMCDGMWRAMKKVVNVRRE